MPFDGHARRRPDGLRADGGLKGGSFGQLAAVSAVLGGFVVTFLGVLLCSSDPRRRGHRLRASSATSAGCLLLAAVGWSLLAAQVELVAAAKGEWADVARRQLEEGLELKRLLGVLFLVGIALLIALIGTSGWLRSRSLGHYTSALAVLLAARVAIVLRPFVH